MIKPPSDQELNQWEQTDPHIMGKGRFSIDYNLKELEIRLRLIAEIRRLREQLKPDCVNGCIFKLARKIAEEGK